MRPAAGPQPPPPCLFGRREVESRAAARFKTERDGSTEGEGRLEGAWPPPLFFLVQNTPELRHNFVW